ncbi:carboxypeptidase regulatory-like domain-containing protein [Spirosoma soli]|uniref:Carboxypeptidase regulatory-like domain-containing protein n=2 Tax=Spirosoma soli TaxID=1770529 RepID=A0ABW5M5S9_9BACT
MPSPDSPRPNPGGVPAEREVLIFPLLNLGQVDAGDNGFVNSVREAKPVKTVKTDKNGKFCVSLPAGRYTVLVREPKGLYANLFDSQSNINPVTVSKNRLSQHRLEITHGAVF